MASETKIRTLLASAIEDEGARPVVVTELQRAGYSPPHRTVLVIDNGEAYSDHEIHFVDVSGLDVDAFARLLVARCFPRGARVEGVIDGGYTGPARLVSSYLTPLIVLDLADEHLELVAVDAAPLVARWRHELEASARQIHERRRGWPNRIIVDRIDRLRRAAARLGIEWDPLDLDEAHVAALRSAAETGGAPHGPLDLVWLEALQLVRFCERWRSYDATTRGIDWLHNAPGARRSWPGPARDAEANALPQAHPNCRTMPPENADG